MFNVRYSNKMSDDLTTPNKVQLPSLRGLGKYNVYIWFVFDLWSDARVFFCCLHICKLLFWYSLFLCVFICEWIQSLFVCAYSVFYFQIKWVCLQTFSLCILVVLIATTYIHMDLTNQNSFNIMSFILRWTSTMFVGSWKFIIKTKFIDMNKLRKCIITFVVFVCKETHIRSEIGWTIKHFNGK